MSKDKKATFKEFGQVSAEELERAINKDQSYVELFGEQSRKDIEDLHDRKIRDTIRILDQLAETRQLRGHHDECENCPLSLSCLAGRNPGMWCASCVAHYNKELELRIICDALKETDAIHDLGACPVCDNGLKVETFVGVRFLDAKTVEEMFGGNAHRLKLAKAARVAGNGIKNAMASPGLAREIFEVDYVKTLEESIEEGDED